MKQELSIRERFREYLKEMWYRYQCYYNNEIETLSMSDEHTGKNLRYYLKYSEEERKVKQQADLAEQQADWAKLYYRIEHWDEFVQQMEEQNRLEDQKLEELKQKIKKIIFFWK